MFMAITVRVQFTVHCSCQGLVPDMKYSRRFATPTTDSEHHPPRAGIHAKSGKVYPDGCNGTQNKQTLNSTESDKNITWTDFSFKRKVMMLNNLKHKLYSTLDQCGFHKTSENVAELQTEKEKPSCRAPIFATLFQCQCMPKYSF